eukprot:jgi/Psemu1/4006/gm1.4006_g
MEDSLFSTIIILIVLKQPKIFLVQHFHIRFFTTQGTIPDDESQTAGTKNHDVPTPPNTSHKSQSPSKGAPKYFTQEDGISEEASNTVARTNKVPAVLTQIGTANTEVGVQAVPPVVAARVVPAANPKANTDQRKPPPTYTKVVVSLLEEDLDYRKHQRSVEKNLGSALNGQTYVNAEFVQALSLNVSTSFTQLMTKVYIEEVVYSISDQEQEKKILLSMFGPIRCQIDVMDYKMKSKWDNVQSLLWHVHGEREVGDTNPCLYGCNVVNYVTIQKYMVVYQEILLWYMENVKYPQRLKKWIRFLKLPYTGSFGFQDVMQTIEDLVLMEQRYLVAQSQFLDKEYKGFRCDDHLYIYPPPGSGVDTKCPHVRFDLHPKPKEILKGSLEMPDVGHIHRSLEILIHFRYLPESRKIFTPLTEPLVEMLVDQLDEIFTAKLEVVFLSQTGVQNIDENFGKEGNEVYLSGVFKHLEGSSNFKYHTLLDFETWECFEDSKTDLQNFKQSQTGPYAAGWVMFTSKPTWLVQYRTKDMVVPPPQDNGSDKVEDNANKSNQGNNKDGNLDKEGNNNGDNVSDPMQKKGSKCDQGNNKDGNLDNGGDDISDPRQNKGNKSDEGNNKDGTSDNNGNLKPKVKPTSLKGAKSSLVRDLEFTPKYWTHIGWGFAWHDIKVMLKDPDPEILYPIYGIGQKVVYIGYTNHIGLSGKVQRNNKENLLGDEDSNSSSDSNNMSDTDKGSVYDPVVIGNSESKEDDECS